MQLCCQTPDQCDYVCPKDIENYIDHIRSIRGFGFENIPLSKPLMYENLHPYIPLIYHSSKRISLLEYDTVAIQLTRLFDYKTGEIKFKSKQELSEYLGFSPSARIVISGVREDIPLEKYWITRKIKQFASQLKGLEPVLVTVPNFSTFSNAPRWNDMFSMKRIGICWSEFLAEGIPASLHLNGRTLRDWERWAKFIEQRPDVKSVSFEFATMFPARRKWYVNRLVELASNVSRDLQLIIRGGLSYYEILNKFYKEVVYIDTEAFVRATKRMILQPESADRFKWVSVASPDYNYIDELLEHNVEIRAEILKQKASSFPPVSSDLSEFNKKAAHDQAAFR
jgi:hypothetical protein